ncbi:TetR/AcrR family transcriptional regulator [Companilactobacillus baiquanensis]|uniref:TetR/AcrR family transcriptional regulator n=1 Tax=Companilactobacillus baiquanensis TaxID=2486005 RepID=A0ABW1UUA7_9LACO|nr:TetR/AcrR family transcriptional regulator [Companilactobacillus baiquanensis]
MKRNTQTDSKIKKSFIKLMEDKGFENLSVSDITDNAKVNRSTFYAHYDDKFDLLQHYEDDTLKSLGQTLNKVLRDKTKRDSVIEPIIGYIESEFDLVKILIKIPSFEDKIRNVLRQVVDQGLYLDKGNDETVNLIPSDYAYEIVVSGLLNTIKYWLSKDHPEDQDTIIDIIMKTRYLSPYDLLGVDDQFGNTIKV